MQQQMYISSSQKQLNSRRT